VIKLDETGTRWPTAIRASRSPGSTIFIAAEGGTIYALIVGMAVPLLRAVVNPLMHQFLLTEDMRRSWLRHNVEEVGLLEYIVPLIYAA
jgi:hypothetical protein